MINRANGRTTVPQIFIAATHVAAATIFIRSSSGRAARRALGRDAGMSDAVGKFRVGLIAMRSGRRPSDNIAAATRLIDEAKRGGATTC